MAPPWTDGKLEQIEPETAADHVSFTDQLSYLFPQQLFWRQHTNVAEFNKQLALLCRDLCKQPLQGGGRQSTGDLFARDAPVLAGLKQLISTALEPFVERVTSQLMVPTTQKMSPVLRGWATILGQGDHVAPHLHRDRLVTGTYYAQVPGSGDGSGHDVGRLVIEHPVSEATMATTPSPLIAQHAIDPRAGLLVMYPAYLTHHVTPLRSQGERIAISFVCSLTS
ncbi:MAG: putative 2OG-Fe(II) oxygenase [Alphaproteobacteria bacterium]|nr:hypothetical protein [Rhodospirillaceae bacterium]MBT6509592.1 hypothetical protein [Rhodospirillaceae bacterium]MBT7611628.1 hypothetical protein [Rhodospirillaceae bacterium]MBT7645477.1 hypothetical protein [Rhodospirillaceae bacterium]MDG2481979.1 putative 2OG-Fe(II) oxygenase [Alphaproteobacteria bacterium]